MARKSIEQLSPAYKRRIERAEAAGKSRQQARGHKAKEHVIRKEREREELGGLSSYEEGKVFMWAAKRSFEISEADLDPLETVEWAKDHGYDAFRVYRDRWNFIRKRYKREVKNGSWATRGIEWLTSEAGQVGVPDVSWLYYH